MGLAVAKYDGRKDNYADMLKKINSRKEWHREQIDPLYAAAARHLAGNIDGMNLLKDFHAFWLGTLDSFPPRLDETENAYKRRVADRKAALHDKEIRLLLEK
ncbi:MAG: hypothetical protein V1796_01360 [Pseudomonadota bacterium]